MKFSETTMDIIFHRLFLCMDKKASVCQVHSTGRAIKKNFFPKEINKIIYCCYLNIEKGESLPWMHY